MNAHVASPNISELGTWAGVPFVPKKGASGIVLQKRAFSQAQTTSTRYVIVRNQTESVDRTTADNMIVLTDAGVPIRYVNAGKNALSFLSELLRKDPHLCSAVSRAASELCSRNIVAAGNRRSFHQWSEGFSDVYRSNLAHLLIPVESSSFSLRESIHRRANAILPDTQWFSPDALKSRVDPDSLDYFTSSLCAAEFAMHNLAGVPRPTVNATDDGLITFNWEGLSKGLLLLFSGPETLYLSRRSAGLNYIDNEEELSVSNCNFELIKAEIVGL